MGVTSSANMDHQLSAVINDWLWVARLRGPHVTRSIDPEKFVALMPQLNASANSQLRLLYLAIGTEDGLISAHGVVKQILKSKGLNATTVETPGYGHEWAFWRVALSDFAPRLFETACR